MKYCEDALKLIKRKVVCGKGCPIFENCPRLILENANDAVDEINSMAIKQAIEALFEIAKKEELHFPEIEANWTRPCEHIEVGRLVRRTKSTRGKTPKIH